MFEIYLKDISLLDDIIFDLQFFANPEDEGRTEDPTERKKKKAREEGNVAKSQELVSALVFLFSFWVLWIMMGTIFASLKKIMVSNFQNLNAPFKLDDIGNSIMSFALDFWKIVGPALLVGAIIAVVGNVAQIGFLFSTKAIQPKFNKVLFTFDKLKKKLFSKESFFNFITSIAKLVVLAGIFLIIIQADVTELINMSAMGLEQSLSIVGNMLLKMFNVAGVFLLAISIPDYLFKKKQHKESLQMTKQELKQELKEDEGDPQIKGQIREMYQSLMNQQNIKKTVPEADVVITNPTHFAVALKYELESMKAPIVLAKGEDKLALMIRELAFENDVAVIENPPLARSLYATTETGDYIPEEFFMVIAEILVQVGKFGAKTA